MMAHLRINFTTTSIPSPTVASSVNVHLHPAMSPVLGPQKSLSQVQLSSDIDRAVRDRPGHVDVPRAGNPTEEMSRQTDASTSLASSVTSIPQQLRENISPTLPSKPQPKRVRVAKLSEEIIARDLDWFKSNQAPGTGNEEPSASLSKADESSPVLVFDTAHTPGRSPSLKKKTPRIVPARRLPRRISPDAAGIAGVSTSELPLSSEPLTEEAFEDVSANEQKPSPERTGPDARSVAITESLDMQQVPPHELPSSESPLLKTPFLNGEFGISCRPSTPLLDTTSDRMESMDISVSGSERVISKSPRKTESIPPQSPQVLQIQSPILPPLAGAWEPPLNLDFKIPQISPPQLAMDANQRRFEDEMTVIYNLQGKTFTGAHMIDISLDESIFTKISKWINRKSLPLYVPRYLSVERI